MLERRGVFVVFVLIIYSAIFVLLLLLGSFFLLRVEAAPTFVRSVRWVGVGSLLRHRRRTLRCWLLPPAVCFSRVFW